MDDVTIIFKLAEAAHNAEKRIGHEARDCPKCLALARVNRKMEQAEEYDDIVVFYIP